MSIVTKIQWCDSTCNPTMGCEGCELWNPKTGARTCYAGMLHVRFGGVTKGYSPAFEELTFWPGRMAEAARWSDLTGTSRKDKPWLDGLPRLIFVSDMSDALSATVPFDFLEEEVVSTVISANGQRHQWLWLTKRPDRMAQFSTVLKAKGVSWPKNLWAGTSVTTQGTTGRIKHLLRVGDESTIRFLSVEPQCEEMDIGEWLPRLDWIIQGGESGRGSHPFQVEWALRLIGQCKEACVAYFLKQLGSTVFSGGRKLNFADGHAGDWSEWPRELRVRQMPRRVPAAPHEAANPLLGVERDIAANGARVPLEVTDAPNKGRQVALKAWETRRENERKRKRSEAARKAWRTRRGNEGRAVGLTSVKEMSTADANPKHWDKYSNLQHVKHALIREYLKGWFPKMALGPTGCRRLLYIDTHAGRGRYRTGELGSPLVALTTLLQHTSRDRMLQGTEVRFYFIEGDQKNATALRTELAGHTLPNNVFAEIESGDCFQIIENAIADMEKDGKRMAPAFIFVDPYTFKLPGELLRKLLSYPKVELFVNVIWRELDMAIQQCRGDCAPQAADAGPTLFEVGPDPEQELAAARRRECSRASREAILNSVFDGDRWRTITAEGADRRAEQCADLFRQMTGAQWGTYLRMLDNGRVRYFLLHLTNHPEGRDLMKECMWKACPDGGFYASKSDSPRQVILLQPEPDFRPLHDWAVERLSAGQKHWQTLTNELREELWLDKHLKEVLRDMKKTGKLKCEGRFAQTQNPLLRLTPQAAVKPLF
jgi:three-Cys-motif partner protein